MIVAAAAAVWFTRTGERPALAVAHLSLSQIHSIMYEELKVIHGGEVCATEGTATPDAAGLSGKLGNEHKDGYPSEALLELFEERMFLFEHVDDYHLAGARVALVSYAEKKGDVIKYNSGNEALADVTVLHALQGGSAGTHRWEIVGGITYESCEPLE